MITLLSSPFHVGLGILHDGTDTSRLYSTLSTDITLFFILVGCQS